MSNRDYGQKNSSSFEAVTSILNNALIDIENDKKLKPTTAQLSKMTGIHRNTISNRVWPVQKLNQIKDTRKAEEKSRKEKIRANTTDVKNAIEAKLSRAQNEVIYWFNEYQDIKRVAQHSDKRLQNMRESRDYYKTLSDTDKRSLSEARQEIEKLRKMLALEDARSKQLMH
ncbi:MULTISPECIES: hypothetical protein [Psychrobacter]|jgi:hypothetical protein|uniref:hypothetical protein n=3 Tax=Moraxellaceae TaxID=468 RepID=UPI000EBA3519|nr:MULTISPECIES: hypothetical protein [Psychrobacter]MBE8610333.1 hypothetical protein [Pseudomonas lundensis]HCI76904.1 hypothetical protein [Psychrobacter sp.]